ncbi:hypothetical protein NO995_05235 [Aestuariibaculum sp. M13]|uniref:hypothetical protein n=1 Tax=Aestuariibaculum sp. M13 TaxID=2967132 RepID=UPI00215A0B57|nr:hypothetical protein [Aestuariibaculum sp. M13]MCR8667075.1 hypothetical protein [Aestuariibaculum sp. M13]
MKKLNLFLKATLVLTLAFYSCSSESNEPECTPTPTLTTNDVTELTDVTATFSGKIVAPTCESTVTSQGFVYAKTTLPKTDDIVIEVNGENISSEITGLERNTLYYMRTFFVNPTGEYYGEQVEFKTAIGEIVLFTKEATDITNNSAVTGGVIEDNGGAPVISSGVCWSTSSNPTVNDSKLENTSGNTDFTLQLSDLLEDTTYYVRAYVTNEEGTTYGEEKTFTTPKLLYKVEVSIGGTPVACGEPASYFYFELTHKFDSNDVIFDAAEGGDQRNLSYVKEDVINDNLEIIIHLAKFNPENPTGYIGGGALNNMKVVITNLGTNEKVVDITLPELFICTDSAYKNIINFNPVDGSHTVERLTYGF